LGKAYTYLRWQTTLVEIQEVVIAGGFEEDLEIVEAERGETGGREGIGEMVGAGVAADEEAVGGMVTRESGCPARSWDAW